MHKKSLKIIKRTFIFHVDITQPSSVFRCILLANELQLTEKEGKVQRLGQGQTGEDR